MKTLLILALILQACGKDDNQTTNTKAESTTTNVSNKQSAVALAVASASDMPSCGSNNTYQLVYVQSEKKFYNCLSTGWNTIEIAAPVTYVKGDKGDKGDSGVSYNSNIWIEPVSGLQFFIGGAVSNYSTIASICVSPYRTPTSSEILNAQYRGLGLQIASLGAPVATWYTSVSQINMTTGAVSVSAGSLTVLCVK